MKSYITSIITPKPDTTESDDSKLIFTVSKEHQTQYDSIVPARNSMPKWFNDQPLNTKTLSSNVVFEPKTHKSLGRSNTISGCPGITDYYETGYIVKSWVDLLITNTSEGVVMQSPNREMVGVYLEQMSADNLIPIKKNHNFHNEILKITSHIQVSATKNTSLLYLSALDGFPNVHVFEGVVPVDVYPVSLKVMFGITGEFDEIFIPHGTPLMRLIPMERVTYSREKKVVDNLPAPMISKCPFFKLGDYLKNIGWVNARKLYK